MRKLDKYDGYDYIPTQLYDITIVTKNPSKYMNENKQNFQVWDIADSPYYYLRKELVKVGIKIHVSSKKYVKEILQRYQKKNGDIKK